MSDPQSHIPNNELLPISEERLKKLILRPLLLKRLNEANKSLFSLEKDIQSLPNSYILLDFISIPESVKSSKVENIHTTVGSAFQAEDLRNYTQISDANKQVLNYKEALIYGYNRIKERGGINIEDIKAINSILV